MAELQTYISNGISKRLSSPQMTWKKLSLCFKWQMVRRYLSDRAVSDTDSKFAHVRDLLKEGVLVCVDYSNLRQRVMKLNHVDDPVCVELDAIPVTEEPV
jgi:hypothetical protein